MKNLIKGVWVDASDGAVIEITNPATKEFIDTVPNATVKDVNDAVEFAYEASKKWAKVSIYDRGEILLKFSDLVIKNKERLAKLLCAETGKPITEARAEINNTKLFVHGYVEKSRHMYGNVIPEGSEPGQEKTIQLTEQCPLGVVGCIIPFNFPCDLFGQKVPSALVMGNSVIVKPSTYNPLILHEYCKLLVEAGIPEGVISVISGDGPTTGAALAKHKLVHLVSVTGSTKVGMETMKNASENLTHVMLELGGNDAFILNKDGNVDLAIEETVWGRLYNTGQVCCASKRFLIHKDVVEEFTSKLVAKIKTLKIGNPSDETVNIGCLINEPAAERVEEQVKHTINQGAILTLGGRRSGAFFEPTILSKVTKDMDVAKDLEIFGPVISIIEFDDIDEAINIANQSSFGLCGNIITENMKTAFYVAKNLEAGGAIINGASFFRAAEMPFGGWKYSGIGNEGISTTLKEMSRTKTIVLKNIL